MKIRYNDDEIIADVFNENRYQKPKVDPLEEMAISLGNIKDKLSGMGGIPMQMGIPAAAPEEMPHGNDGGSKIGELLAQLSDIANQLQLYMPGAAKPMGQENDVPKCGCGRKM